MEAKKSQKANLEKKRLLFLEIGFVVVIGTVLIAFNWTTKPKENNMFTASTEDVGEEEIVPITRQQEVQPPPPAPPQVFELNIVENDVEIENQLELEDMTAKTDMEMALVPVDEEQFEEEEVFIIVEDMPKFQGGEPSTTFRTWIQQNLRYPEIAAENGISGRVFVQFAVNSKGEVVDAKVVRGVDPALDKEALRVVMASPKWAPGKQRGKPVKVQFTFPIVFVLQ